MQHKKLLKMPKLKLIICLLTIGIITMLTGCSFLKPVSITPSRQYLLNTPEILQIKKTSSKSIVVLSVTADSWLATPQMAYQLQPDQINYFANNQWAAAPAELFQTVLMQSLQRSGRFKAVLTNNTVSAQRILMIKLTDFQQIFVKKPSIYKINFSALLINNQTGKVIAEKSFMRTLACPSDTPQGGVTTANQLIQTLMPLIIQFADAKTFTAG